jgi:hypothetical protein
VLIKTNHTAALLLGMTALCVKFINCAYQDGHAGQPFGERVSRVVQWFWPALLVLVAVAGWALCQRVAHRGWTGERIWAGLVFTIKALYSLGYSLSILILWKSRKQLTNSEEASPLSTSPATWMPTIAPTNILAACVLVVALSLLLTPWLHPNLLAMRSQLTRLANGSVAPEDFDYRVLSNAGHEGELALKTLAAKTDTKIHSPRDVAIAQRAKLRLEGNDYEQYRGDHELDEATQPRITEAALRAKVTVLPKGMVLDAGLVSQMLQSPIVSPSTPPSISQLTDCGSPEYNCAVWYTDLNKDGRLDAVLITERIEIANENAKETDALSTGQTTDVSLLVKNGTKGNALYWNFVGSFTGESYTTPGYGLDGSLLTDWIAAIEARQVKPISPKWPDIEIKGWRWAIQAQP